MGTRSSFGRKWLGVFAAGVVLGAPCANAQPRGSGETLSIDMAMALRLADERNLDVLAEKWIADEEDES